jgi:hypothetical protein
VQPRMLARSWSDPRAAQEEKEKRRLEQLERRKEAQRLLQEEDSRLKGGKARGAAPSKVTRAQIEDTLRREHAPREEPGVAVVPRGGRPGCRGLRPACPLTPPPSPCRLCSRESQESPGGAAGGESEPTRTRGRQRGCAHDRGRHRSTRVRGRDLRGGARPVGVSWPRGRG